MLNFSQIKYFDVDTHGAFDSENVYFIRRRTRVWALAPKPESVDTSFRFSHDGGVSSHEVHHKKSILLFVSHLVSGEVRST